MCLHCGAKTEPLPPYLEAHYGAGRLQHADSGLVHCTGAYGVILATVATPDIPAYA